MTKEAHYKLNLNLVLYPLQQEIYDYASGNLLNPFGEVYRFFVACFGRQTGKSFFCKKLALDRAINFKEKVMWVAPAISTAQTHWDDIEATVLRAMEKGFKVKSINQSRKQIKFFGGGQITIRSAIQPDRLRGPSLDLIICDEAAFYPDGENTFYSIIQPMVTATGGKIILASTPNGRNWFYDLYRQGLDAKDEFWKSWTATAYQSPYQNHKLLDSLKKKLPSKKWRQEYLAEFLADAGGVFAGVDEAARMDMIFAPIPGHEYVFGIDIGFVNDETAVCALDKYTREQVYGESWTGVGTLQTLRRLYNLFNIWQPSVTMFEKNGLGETFFDLIREVFSGKDPDADLIASIFDTEEARVSTEEEENEPDAPKRPVSKEIILEGGRVIRGVHMNNEMKRAFVDGLSADIEYKRLPILTDKTDYGMKQISQMSTYNRVPTASGMSITYKAQEGAHDDLIAALYLARKALPRLTVQKHAATLKSAINPFRGSGKTEARWNKKRA